MAKAIKVRVAHKVLPEKAWGKAGARGMATEKGAAAGGKAEATRAVSRRAAGLAARAET